jgi:mRNA-degrading endonuclease toxin of MazEF toxin-antitoxin module
MSITPEPGLVIRYDFLWKDEARTGREEGTKDRPCAVVLATRPKDGQREVVLCPITHTPPRAGETAVEIPYKVARYLKLDSDRMWIKTHEVNRLQWEEGQIPYGVSRARPDAWAFGMLPQALGRRMFEQVRENSRRQALGIVTRSAAE